MPYDSLIVGAGAGQSYFGHDEFSHWAPGMKTIDDALEIRGRILGAFEMAVLEEDPEKRREWLTFVVVGGGPTGVEIAGQMGELSRRVLPEDFHTIDSQSARVLLFDGGKEILASFGDRLSSKAAKELEPLGVEIHTGSIVTERRPSRGRREGAGRRGPARGGADEDLGGRSAGVAARQVARRRHRRGLRPGWPRGGAAGLLAARASGGVRDRRHGRRSTGLPGVAEVAMQQGIHASRTIKRRLEGEDSAPFRYRDLGSMAMVSRFRAVVSFKGIRVAGFLGWLMWLFVHLTFMTGFRNRFTTILGWTFSFLGRERSQRTLTFQQVVGRVAIEEAGGRPFLMSLTSEKPAEGDRT